MIRTYTLERRTTDRTDIIDLTDDVAARVAESGVTEGHVVIFVPGSTGAITTIEYESGVISDLRKAIDRMAPESMAYEHNARWGDGNGYSHVRAAMMGASLYVPVIGGKLTLGTWQQIVLCDFDNRARRRRIVVQVCGE